MSRLSNFTLSQKIKNQRNEFLTALLADLLIIDKNSKIMVDRTNVKQVAMVYTKVYFEKTLKQIAIFLTHEKFLCELHSLGLTVTLNNCSIQIFKEKKK